MMNSNNYKLAMTVMALMAAPSNGFVVTPILSKPTTTTTTTLAGTAPYFVDLVEKDTTSAQEIQAKPQKKSPAPKKTNSHGKEGIFTPAVKAAKLVLGTERLNKIRGNVIGMHSDVIAAFVNTSDSEFGQAVLKQLFQAADTDGSGSVDKEELGVALRRLGFELNDKQIGGILDRADGDESGDISLEEWMVAAPKTLRTNLTKLAKKNGGELGLLA